MVVIMKREFTPEQLEAAVHTMEEGGVKVMVSKGAETTILGAEGNAEHIDQEKLSLLPGVERVMRVTEPYKKANRKYHPEDTVIELSNGRSVGGNRLAVIDRQVRRRQLPRHPRHPRGGTILSRRQKNRPKRPARLRPPVRGIPLPGIFKCWPKKGI